MGNVTISTMDAAVSPLAGSELMEMSQLSATVLITAATLSAINSDNSYNDSGSGFVTAGFAVGNRVNVAGFTGNVANNILTGAITALTAQKMTIGGADGNVIVDDAAGETVTITKWTTKRASVKDVGAGSNTSYVAAHTISSASNVLTLDLAADSNFITTLTENVTTITIANIQSGSNRANFFTLRVKQDGTGGRTWTNPAAWKFGSGTIPYVPSTAANSIDLLQGITYDAGTTWLITYAKGFS